MSLSLDQEVMREQRLEAAVEYLDELGLPIELTYLPEADFWTAELGGDSETVSSGETLAEALILLVERDLQ